MLRKLRQIKSYNPSNYYLRDFLYIKFRMMFAIKSNESLEGMNVHKIKKLSEAEQNYVLDTVERMGFSDSDNKKLLEYGNEILLLSDKVKKIGILMGIEKVLEYLSNMKRINSENSLIKQEMILKKQDKINREINTIKDNVLKYMKDALEGIDTEIEKGNGYSYKHYQAIASANR